MTTPPGGSPPLTRPAQDAINAARERLAGMQGRPVFPPPRPALTPQDREETLKAAADGAVCLFCGGIHPGASTPACPRLASFKLNGDGKITEGSFWPDSVTDTVTETGPDGAPRTVTFHTHTEWDTTRVVFPADAAEDSGNENPDD